MKIVVAIALLGILFGPVIATLVVVASRVGSSLVKVLIALLSIAIVIVFFAYMALMLGHRGSPGFAPYSIYVVLEAALLMFAYLFLESPKRLAASHVEGESEKDQERL